MYEYIRYIVKNHKALRSMQFLCVYTWVTRSIRHVVTAFKMDELRICQMLASTARKEETVAEKPSRVFTPRRRNNVAAEDYPE